MCVRFCTKQIRIQCARGLRVFSLENITPQYRFCHFLSLPAVWTTGGLGRRFSRPQFPVRRTVIPARRVRRPVRAARRHRRRGARRHRRVPARRPGRHVRQHSAGRRLCGDAVAGRPPGTRAVPAAPAGRRRRAGRTQVRHVAGRFRAGVRGRRRPAADRPGRVRGIRRRRRAPQDRVLRRLRARQRRRPLD